MPRSSCDPSIRRRVLVAFNPRAGSRSRRDRIAALEEALATRHADVQTVTEPAELTRLTTAIETEPAESQTVVVAAGGDGTFGEVINRVPAGVAVAPFPLGTENLISRYLGSPAAPHAAAENILNGDVVCVDAGRANGRLFALMIGIGFDAEVVRRVAAARRGNITRMTYVKPLLGGIRSYQYPKLRVYCDLPENSDECWDARWVFGVNLPKYALGLNFTPLATGNDGLLDICTFGRGSFWQGVRYLASLILGVHPRLPDVVMTRTPWMRVESATGDQVPYQLDGDGGGFLPVEVVMLPGRLRVVVAPSRARELNLNPIDEMERPA